jgi:hypothetical protein
MGLPRAGTQKCLHEFIHTVFESNDYRFVTMAPPTFAGMSGRKLSWTVSTIATMGFLLFGYDRK